MNTPSTEERLHRWRLVLGAAEKSDGTGCALSADELRLDAALSALYDAQGFGGQGGGKRSADLSASSPNVTRWLGDIRQFFPKSIVQVMQKDAMERLNLKRLLLEPEMLETVEPDIHLVGTLLSLNSVIPEKTKATARLVVRRVVEELERRLASPLRQAITGSLNRSARNRRPRHNEIDWHRTIRANLKHYQPEYRTIVPETRIGFGRKTAALRDIILCVDQSGSMAGSIVYSGVMAAVMASLRAVRTSLVFFDTAVVDMTEKLADPVDVLFGAQLGGGTDIHRAVTYCQSLIARPAETIFVLISDLIEGGNKEQLYQRVASIAASGVNMITLLALDDSGAPCFDHEVAGTFTSLGVPSFTCTPDLFPDLMANAIQRRDISQWAATQGIKVERGEKPATKK
ncbi:VWA containing CoxE family protein [Chthoniobacter flavus Ellin428]|uniref:VWA containing CoxE family protein n=1 Tax=Chthoniobacter flavus Ellin428 TaxID=497964 RepID=B4CZ84_9BACT|nr:VWA domain-containing protein [Chthoniobacter flavus]EDY20775.1 VWA containing CoxE family protein [Chthoniobacter flavus Ellin428]TCO89669.1 VWA domain containing CoxE-like protein [Chthoniobacter flavus]